MDSSALFELGYGLYVLTTYDNGKDNGCIINTVMQIVSSPSLIGVIAVSKRNHTHDMILNSRKFNTSVLTTDTPFAVFEHFGFKSGAKVDKFATFSDIDRCENGIVYLKKYTSAFLSFELIDTIDFGSHTMFKSAITGGAVIDENKDSVTYSYYHRHIKPKPKPTQKHGYRCIICNYIYEGDYLPADYICPLCKHGASDFVKI